MDTPTLRWTGKALSLLDQTLLPNKTKYIAIRDEKAMWEAIKMLRVRGAPAIDVAAAYGFYLGVARQKPATGKQVKRLGEKVARYLATSRPTAVNLFWALDRCRNLANGFPDDAPAKECLARLLEEAQAIQADDERTCALIGKHGAPLLKGVKGVVTHCNAGALATAGIGTAVGVITTAAKTGKFTVYADETRPLLQGARLTMWELQRAGIDARLVTDSMATTVLQRRMAQAIVVGADRIAANGDAANKVGTMPLAIVAKFYKVPFYVAAPLSTFDLSIKSGADIPIEERGREEIVNFGGTSVAPKGVEVFSPAFDVTPAALIAGIITEVGVLRAPYKKSIAEAAARAKA